MEIRFKIDTAEDLEMLRNFFINGKEEKRAMTDAEKQKAYRERKKALLEGNEIVTDGNGDSEAKESTKENIYINSSTNNPNTNSLEDNTTNTSVNQNELFSLLEEKEEKEINKENEEKVIVEVVTKKRNRKRDQPEFKRKYGQFHNVLLSNEELEKLQKKFPDTWQDQIEELSLGIESRGYKYKSHYAALLTWAKKNGIQEGRHPIARVSNIPRRMTAQEIGAMLDLEERQNA